MGKKAQERNAANSVGWEVHVDPSTNRTFYYNAKTGQSSWRKPEAFLRKSGSRRTIREWSFLPDQEEALPELVKFFNKNVWKQHLDSKTGRVYFVNSATKESVWLKPIRDGQV